MPVSRAGSFRGRPAAALEITVQRQLTSRLLNYWMPIVQGTCPVRFAYHSDLCAQPHAEHLPALRPGCPEGPSQDEFKDMRRNFVFPYMRYCWHCMLPNDYHGNGEQPRCHAEHNTRGKACPWQHFIHIVLRCLYEREEVRQAFIIHFGLSPKLSFDEYRVWVNAEDQEECYYNGLELFAWYCWNVLGTEGVQ